MSEAHSNSRLAAYKSLGAKGNQDLRRKRADVSIALRKQARDEQLLKRRALSPDGTEDEVIDSDELPTPQEIVKGLHSDDVLTLLKSARAARRMLSREQNPPIAVMMEAGCIKPLVRALDRDDCVELQFEAAWALTNIASGTHDQTIAVVDANAIPKLVHLLSGPETVAEQCAWAIGNIAGDGPATRDAVLKHGVVQSLIPLLNRDTPKPRLRTAVWTYSNLCRNKNPMVNFDLVAPVLPYLSDLLTIDDNDVLTDSCWAISYLTDGPNERIEAVQSTPHLLTRVIALLSHPTVAVRTPALRATGNMLTGSDEQTDRVLEAGVIPQVVSLLTCNKASLVKEAAWAASNVLAGTHAQIQVALDGGILEALLGTLMHSEPKCQKEAAWAITNLCLGGSGVQLAALIGAGVLRPYTSLLSSLDVRTVIVVLEGITNLLQAAEKFGEVEQMCIRLEEEGAVDRLEALQTHENEQVYKKVLHIIDTFFSEDGDEAKNAPEEDGLEFKFGTNSDQIGQF